MQIHFSVDSSNKVQVLTARYSVTMRHSMNAESGLFVHEHANVNANQSPLRNVYNHIDPNQQL